MGSQALDERGLSKLRWRCRRGMLENDLIIERFFERHAAGLTVAQGQAMNVLMELSDNELLDLLLRRTEPQDALDSSDVRQVLEMLRTPRQVP